MPFDCYLIMTVLALAHLKLPELVLEFTKTVGNANTFLSLCMIGLGLELSMTKEQAGSVFKVVGARFFVSAVLSVLLYRFAPFGDEIRRTLAILMFAPVSGLGVAYTSLMDGDVKLSCAVNSVSIIVGIVSLTGAIMIF